MVIQGIKYLIIWLLTYIKYNCYYIGMKTNQTEWLSPSQAAKRLGVSRVTLYRYINQKSNPLPAYKLSTSTIKINSEEIDKWVSDMLMKKLK